jgi:hypothetical protein
MTKKRVRQQFPPGWNEERVRKVLDNYENQTEEERAAAFDALGPACRMLLTTRDADVLDVPDHADVPDHDGGVGAEPGRLPGAVRPCRTVLE